VPPVVVADAGPLIALARCRHLPLLAEVFAAIHLPQAVLEEAAADIERPGARDIAAFAASHARIHPNRDDALYADLRRYLDEGEAQALCLARALGCGVLMDERRGRAAARRLELPLSGILGVLLAARRGGRLARIAPVLRCLQTNGYRIAPTLIVAALEAAGESGEGIE
jgi:predicted nucleic acid-binding protein